MIFSNVYWFVYKKCGGIDNDEFSPYSVCSSVVVKEFLEGLVRAKATVKVTLSHYKIFYHGNLNSLEEFILLNLRVSSNEFYNLSLEDPESTKIVDW